MSHLKVGIIMGSQSDLNVMSEAAEILEKLGLSSEVSICLLYTSDAADE